MAERSAVQIAGRETELALLTGAVADVQAGRGRAVLIDGEAGIGKSALLTAALAGVDPVRCRVVLAACDELTQRFPLAAVTEALGPDGYPGDDQPGLSGGLGPFPDDPVLAALEELIGSIHRLTADRPLVLVLEDVHWADEASVLLWRRLSRVTPQIPLLLAGTRRPLPRGAPLERDVQVCGGIALTLTALPAGDVARMVTARAGGAPGPRLLHWLESAGGNPFYVRELLDAAVRSGAVQPAGRDAPVELLEQAADGGLSRQVTSLRQAVASRLDFLPGPALQMLRIAALLGPEFPVTDLTTATGQSASGLLPVVVDAIAAGILESAGARLRFRHGLLQQALYEGMPTSMRAGLHRQTARSLIEQGAPAERIARQLLALPDTGEGWETDWLAANATHLAARAPAVTVTLLEQALRTLAATDARRTVLEDHLAWALFALGRLEQVERLTAAILPQATNADRYGHLTWTRVYALMRTHRDGKALAVLDTVAARPGLGAVWQARFQALRALLRYADPSEAIGTADAAIAEARRLGDPAALGYALQARVNQHFLARDFTTALELIDQALPLTATDPRLADLRLLLITNWVDLTGELGRSEEAAALARRTLASCEPSGSPRLGTLRFYLAYLAYETGRWDEATAEIDAITGTEEGSGQTHSLSALIAGHQDDWTRAAEHLTALKRWAAEYTAQQGIAFVPHANVALALALEREAAGDAQGAADQLTEWLGFGAGHDLTYRYKVLPVLVRLALAAADEPAAQAGLQVARREAGQEPRVRRQAVADWCAGLIQAEPDTVLAAARTLGEFGLAVEAASALEDAAVGFAQAGETGTARSVLDEALAGYGQLGAAWDARRAAARIRPYGIRPGVRNLRQRPQTGWQSLTSTETQVAELLAEGRSNPDIAAQLFISRRTVESHVSHILAKLQLTSRWEVKKAATE